MTRRGMTRRECLRGLGAALGAVVLGRCGPAAMSPTPSRPTETLLPVASPTPGPAVTSEPTSTLDTNTPTPEPTSILDRNTPTAEPIPGPPRTSRVVHIHAQQATYWDFSSGWYGDYVQQAAVDGMVDQGLMQLTGTTSVNAAWGVLLPAYQPGQKIAVKVNFNNSGRDGATCGSQGNLIDSLPQPALALVRGLVEARGVEQGDIWIYDASRKLPDRFRQPVLDAYSGVQFWGLGECSGLQASFGHINDSLRVSFGHPSLRDRWLTDLLYQATYLINMPILKGHGIHPVSLGFKNHFGSLDNVVRGGEDNLHFYIAPQHSLYSANHSPLVDIYANPNIAGKTVLTLADGLFAGPGASAEPMPLRTFGGAPNSLLLSRDPVAIDCVMCDLIRGEWKWLPEAAYDYLQLAAERGLGTFEQGDPWDSGYRHIEYLRLSL